MIWTAVPAEVSRWYRDAATEAELDSDHEKALEYIDRAIQWNPHEANLFLQRAQTRLDVGQLEEALEDCNHALELEPENRLVTVYQRLLIHQRKGDHDQALVDADEIVKLSTDQPAASPMSFDNALNLRAYARALANQQIKEGLQDIENAMVRQGGGNDNAAFLDTRGYLRYLDGDAEAALPDMERAVELAEARTERLEDEPKPGELSVWREQERLARKELAVLYQHRGLVYEKLGQQEKAAQDFARALENGYSPEDGVW